MTLCLADVTVAYGATVALQAVSLEVPAGERLAVLGPSGSGKSTLLRAVAGLERPAHGVVSWNGRDLAGVPAHARGFGLMFQDYALFPHRDVAGNVAFGLEMRGEAQAGIARRVDEVLGLVGLAGYGRRRPSELSGGEQQRVALARALAPRPVLLMLDEPLGALDRGLRERLLAELDGLFRSLDLTILYVTHDQEEALAIGDRVAILRGGRLEAVDSPVALWRRPPSAWTARFLGLRNISPAIVADGMADTAWGRLPVGADAPTGRVQLLLRPEALRPSADGPIHGTVVASTFRGSLSVLRVDVVGAPALEVYLSALSGVPNIGEPVSLAIAAGGVVLLPPDDDASLEP